MSLRGQQARARLVSPTVRLLVITVGGVNLALPADRVEGLLTREEAGPGDSVTLRGVTYYGVDLAGRLGLPAEAEGPDARVVLLRDRQRRGAIRAAIVHNLEEIEQTQVRPLPKQFRRGEQTWYRGMVLFQETVALVLNPAWVLEGVPADPTVEGGVLRSGARQWLSSDAVSAGGPVTTC